MTCRLGILLCYILSLWFYWPAKIIITSHHIKELVSLTMNQTLVFSIFKYSITTAHNFLAFTQFSITPNLSICINLTVNHLTDFCFEVVKHADPWSRFVELLSAPVYPPLWGGVHTTDCLYRPHWSRTCREESLRFCWLVLKVMSTRLMMSTIHRIWHHGRDIVSVTIKHAQKLFFNAVQE